MLTNERTLFDRNSVTDQTDAPTLPTSKLAIIVQQGRILDFIDGHMQRRETPEEYVRQEIAKSLVREYRYDKASISVEFTLRLGSRKPRADLVIFPNGVFLVDPSLRCLIDEQNHRKV